MLTLDKVANIGDVKVFLFVAPASYCYCFADSYSFLNTGQYFFLRPFPDLVFHQLLETFFLLSLTTICSTLTSQLTLFETHSHNSEIISVFLPLSLSSTLSTLLAPLSYPFPRSPVEVRGSSSKSGKQHLDTQWNF